MLELVQHDALSSLRGIWPGVRIVMIGATALRLQRGLNRSTEDIDLVLALDVTDFPGALAVHPDWTRHPKQLQRWTYRHRVRLDLLPVGEQALAQGWLIWPDGVQMNVAAFELLAHPAVPVLQGTQDCFIAPVALIALMKMISWLDRPAQRGRDIDDLVWLLDNYLDPHNDYDFDRLLSVGYGEHAQAILLAHDIASYGKSDIARRFVNKLERQYAFIYERARGVACADDARFIAFRRVLLGDG